MNVHGINVCSFTADLDEMKRKDQDDTGKVLAALQKAGRFSVFEATANATIARTMDRLVAQKLIHCTHEAYPWTKVEIAEAGKRYL